MSKTFFRYTFIFEVLSEDRLSSNYMNLTNLAYEVEEGSMSGQFYLDKEEELDGQEMAQALMDQGSAPEFFMLDQWGNDLEHEVENA